MFLFFLLLSQAIFANVIFAYDEPTHEIDCKEDNEISTLSSAHLDGQCEDGKEKVNLFKAAATEYKLCPTAKSCFQKGSKVYMNSTKGLYLGDFSVLKTFENSSFHLTGNAFFKLAGRSFLANKGKFYSHAASIMLFSRSEIVNHGMITFGQDCDVKLHSHASIYLYATTQLLVNDGSELRISTYSRLTFDVHSHRHENDHSHSELFTLQNGSTLHLSDAAMFHHINGKVDINRKSKVEIRKSSLLYVDGTLELPSHNELKLRDQSYMFIGHENTRSTDSVSGGSLIFSPGTSLHIGSRVALKVSKFAYCLLIKPCYLNESVELFSNSTTEYFKCFSDKQDLIAASAVVGPSEK